MSKRIGIDARIIATGTGRYIERLVTYLQDVDKENEYFIFVRTPELDYWKPKQKNFNVVEANYGDFGFSEQIGFLKQLNSMDLDLVHFCMPQFPILYRRKFVSTIHDLTMFHPMATPGNTVKNLWVFKLKLIVFGFVFNKAARKAKTVITPSRFTKVALIERVGRIDPEKVHITYESADLIKDKAEPVEKLIDKDFLFFVGRAWPYKNIQTLIDGYALAKQNNPELQLVLAGKKESFYEELEAYAEAEGIKDVHFLGFVSEGELRWLYENTAAYVFPSFSEGFGLPGLEAMKHGAPVISSNATCLPEVYGDGALYFDPNKPEELAKLINDLMTNDKLRNELAANGSKQVQKYSWDKMARETHDIYMKAIDS